MTTDEKHKEARRLLCRYLYNVAKEKGITQDEIAERTGFQRYNVSRMLAGRYSPTLDNFIKLAEAVDVYIFIIEKDTDDDLVKIMQNRWGNTPTN